MQKLFTTTTTIITTTISSSKQQQQQHHHHHSPLPNTYHLKYRLPRRRDDQPTNQPTNHQGSKLQQRPRGFFSLFTPMKITHFLFFYYYLLLFFFSKKKKWLLNTCISSYRLIKNKKWIYEKIKNKNEKSKNHVFQSFLCGGVGSVVGGGGGSRGGEERRGGWWLPTSRWGV